MIVLILFFFSNSRACCRGGRPLSRQAGSECVEHEPALPRVRGTKLAAPALARASVRGERARLPAQQQQPSAERMRGLRRKDRRAVPPSCTRQILASRVPKVHVLRTSARGHGQIFLLQRRNDIMQKRLHKVRIPQIYFSIFINTYN